MNKKSILIIAAILLTTFAIISLYSTFAFNEDLAKLDKSSANYNLVYSLKEVSPQEVIVNASDEVYVDLKVNNSYDSNVKYGAYYQLIKPSKGPDGFTVTLVNSSESMQEEVIKPTESKVISVKLTNNSNTQVTVNLGVIVGFENGNIAELTNKDQILIK